MSEQIYQFKISLKGTAPLIWRRIQIPSTNNFWDLHVAIQDAMGWYDCHLHQFEFNNGRSGQREFIGIPDAEWGSDKILAGWDTAIKSRFSLTCNQAHYDYDFGDGWRHLIKLEKILPMDSQRDYPCCLAGKRACPPEDCGGIWGYREIIDILNDPTHERHGEMKEWVGADFSAEKFDPRLVRFDNPKTRLETALQIYS